ncbi:hypothetical protein DL93DRAFT_2061014, partial [Clavulina sp. PMI_390]
ASKANLQTLLPFATGGSWKKSPQTTSYKRYDFPPKGFVVFRSRHAIRANLSKSSPSTIETMRKESCVSGHNAN